MRFLKFVLLLIALFAMQISTVYSRDSSSSQPLQSDELQSIKAKYEECVFSKGIIILQHESFKDAIEYAPMACRKLLLQSKKYLLASAFNVEVINELVNSIEEGVRIDLVNLLIQELQKDGK